MPYISSSQIHELINLPHGEAEKWCRTHEFWDDSLNPTYLPFNVTVSLDVSDFDDEEKWVGGCAMI